MKSYRLSNCAYLAKWFCSAGLLAFLAIAVILWPQEVKGQQPVVPKLTLAQVEQLVAHSVPDSTLSSQIQKRGLAFAPTPAIVESLRAKGAGPLTLEAIEGHLPTGTRSAVTARAQLTLGSGLSGPAGVAVDQSGNVFVADGCCDVKMILADGGYTKVSTLCTGRAVFGVATDGSSHIFLVGPGISGGGTK